LGCQERTISDRWNPELRHLRELLCGLMRIHPSDFHH
jgi:hypothetical protein